jgi:hypothetical protein
LITQVARIINCETNHLMLIRFTMRLISFTTTTIFLLFAIQTMAVAQSTNVTETFKKHFNETVQQVHQTENADEKRAILNDSFAKMISAIDRIETKATLSENDRNLLNSYKSDILNKQNELAGLDGFNQVNDADLDEFSSYTQDFLEQANRTVTIGVTTAILIILILLLL